MSSRRAAGVAAFVFLHIPFVPSTLTAQDEGPPRFHAGLSGVVAQPLGEFDDYVDVGGGLEAHFRVNLDRRGIVSLRAQAGFVNYGSETKRVCLSQTVGCRIQVDLTTSNNIFLLGVGPELGLPLGPVRLYGNATVGLGHFSTDSRVEGTSGADDPFATTTNFSDGGFAWTAGGGLQVRVAEASGSPISIDLGTTYQRNGLREYLTEGGIIDRPDGSIELDVRRSEANLLLWRIGVSVGFQPEDDGN